MENSGQVNPLDTFNNGELELDPKGVKLGTKGNLINHKHASSSSDMSGGKPAKLVVTLLLL